MKGDMKVIETLNSLLGRELTVVSQYMDRVCFPIHYQMPSDL
jgi:bacterioferritin (cytochrome b1)